MRHYIYLGAFVVVACVELQLARPGHAAKIVSHTVLSNPAEASVSFNVLFDESVDLFAVDIGSRQADEFQFYIDPEGVPIPGPAVQPPGVDIIIRGGEIHIDGDIRIRDRSGQGGPGSGGWGPIRGAVPFELSEDSRSLSFTAGFELLGETDGDFTYALQTLEFGETSDIVFGRSAVPEPSGWLLACSTCLMLIARARKRVSKSPKGD
jgi:hypothetical protein